MVWASAPAAAVSQGRHRPPGRASLRARSISRSAIPWCDTAQDLKAAAEAAIAKELRLKGVVLADAEIISAMDAEEPGLSLEKVFNSDGTVSRNATAVDREEMGALLRHAQRLAGELAGEMRGGRIAAQPAALGTWSACAYCEYRSICGLDPKDTAAQRKMPELDKEEFRALLANEGKTGGEKQGLL